MISRSTGLFYFRGNPGAKFAIVNAGGGFVYVGAMHDSFPHMQALAARGYNAFALIYRPGAALDFSNRPSAIFPRGKNLETQRVSNLGAQTACEGWLDNAVAFWERNMKGE